MPSTRSLRDELARGELRLSQAGCETPRLDAELLLGSALGGLARGELVVRAHDEVPAPALARYDALLQRRAQREPVAYVLGTKPFRRLDLQVDRRVLIPRPETELLVEVGLELPRGARVADVGTGSGALALALADERPDLHVWGIDRSADALAVAEANGERIGSPVQWRVGDLLEPVGEVDAVLANLPYVEVGASLAPEIARWEPAEALFAGDDGLALIRRLVDQAAGRPAVRLLAMEIGSAQGDAVDALVRGAGFTSVERRRDLAGLERVVVARR